MYYRPQGYNVRKVQFGLQNEIYGCRVLVFTRILGEYNYLYLIRALERSPNNKWEKPRHK